MRKQRQLVLTSFDSLRLSKQGQITVFVIIGIILIIAIGLVIFTQREQILEPTEAELVRVAEVPQTVQPIQNFVQDCLYTTAKQGLEILGERGGYIEPRQRHNPFQPTDGAAVQFAPESEIKIPYWWHMNSRNDCTVGTCTFDSEQPRLTGPESIESQLDSHIKEKLPECLGEFRQFGEQQFSITPTGQINPATQITKRNVIVILDYPLEITRAGEKYTTKDYAAELPVNFYEMYELATNITNLQAEHTILERATRTLIDVFGRADETALPPVAEMEFGFGMGEVWTKMGVERKIQEMLTSYIPLLKVTYTKNYRYIPAPPGTDRQMYEVLYNRGFTVPVLTPHKSLETRFVYLPWWKPYFDLNCNGQLCQPEGFSSTFGFMFGVRRYNFAYDISYPVMVEITNPDAFGGEGYSLRFFLEANMRNNEPLAIMDPPLSVPDITDRDSLLCDPRQRTGGNITVNVRSSSGTRIEDAQIIYKCGTESCWMGPTTNGQLVTAFPRCIGGFITATHEDYPAGVKAFDVLDDTEQTADITLPNPYIVDFTAKKWLLRKQSEPYTVSFGTRTITRDVMRWELDMSAAQNQGPRETTIIMLERKSGSQYEEPIVIVSEVCGAPIAKAKIPCGDPPSDTSKDVTLYAGDYHVTIYSFLHPQPDVVIPPDRRCYDADIFGGEECFWIPPEPIVFSNDKDGNPLLSGQAEFDWTITEEELQGAKEIEFRYINFALEKVRPASKRVIEDLEMMGNLFKYSEQHPELLEPVIR